MLVIVGLLVVLVAVTVAVVGLLANSGVAHRLSENFSVFGVHITGSTGAVFLFGIVVGAVAMLGLSVLLVGARRTASRGRVARRELEWSQREAEFANRNLDNLRHDRQVGVPAGAQANSEAGVTHPSRRWPWTREPTGTH